MGWTYTYKPEGMSASEFLRDQFNDESDAAQWEMLDIAIVRFRTAYAAIRKTRKETAESEVFGLVCLLDYRPADHYNFGWKEISDDMGPVESECPERILNLLTPTTHEYAIEWRERCQRNLEKKARANRFMRSLRPGDVLRHEQGLSFTSGVTLTDFMLLSKKPLIFANHLGLGRYVIPRRHILEMTKVENAKQAQAS